jgi:hypothetical protein
MTLQELEEWAARLQASARKLPSGPDRHDILHEIGRFRAQVAALRISDTRPARRWSKAKGK